MDEKTQALLARIAQALERLAPPVRPEPEFGGARLYRHEPKADAFLPAPDYPLPLDLLVGVDGQKARFVENLTRFARRLPANHALLWGVRGTGKSSLAKAAFMAVAANHPGLTLIEVDRDEVAALPPLFDALRGRTERFVVLCDDLSFEDGAAAAKALKSALEAAWPALAPVFGASPYLAGLARRRPAALRETLESDPEDRLGDILQLAHAQADEADDEVGRRVLRELKGDLHLLTALADLGGVWDLDQVTGALARFADAALHAAVALTARAEIERGRLVAVPPGAAGPIPGLMIIAMGKHGAFELNYSSDIDISFFYEPERLPLAEGVEPGDAAVRIAHGVARTLQDRTADGYVFRVDLRLRPDPSSTPPAVPAPAAFTYYESVGQNWERAAFIKARAAGGDLPAGEAFLAELKAFVWRKNLDFAAIADIHSIKRQIHAYKVDDRLTARGADLKLGGGGIREIEFYVQTQQLILGGRHPDLRSNRTLDALAALASGEGKVKKAKAEKAVKPPNGRCPVNSAATRIWLSTCWCRRK